MRVTSYPKVCVATESQHYLLWFYSYLCKLGIYTTLGVLENLVPPEYTHRWKKALYTYALGFPPF